MAIFLSTLKQHGATEISGHYIANSAHCSDYMYIHIRKSMFTHYLNHWYIDLLLIEVRNLITHLEAYKQVH